MYIAINIYKFSWIWRHNTFSIPMVITSQTHKTSVYGVWLLITKQSWPGANK